MAEQTCWEAEEEQNRVSTECTTEGPSTERTSRAGNWNRKERKLMERGWVAVQAFDRHESVLVEQKTQHRRLQTGREARQADPRESRRKRQEEKKTQQTDLIKDPGLRRYEEMLDMAIEASRNGRRQYPLKLFGYVINYALLAFWIAGLGWPLVRQLQGILPSVVEQGCAFMEDYALHGLQGRLDRATHFTNDALRQVEGEAGAGDMAPRITLKELFHSSVCLPLVNAMEGRLEQLEQKAKTISDAGSGGPGPGPEPEAAFAGSSTSTSRRLSSRWDLHAAERAVSQACVELPQAIQRWWATHDALDPRIKLALAQLQLQGLQRSALRLLREAPQAVVDAYVARGLAAALALARRHRGEEADEPLALLSPALRAVRVV